MPPANCRLHFAPPSRANLQANQIVEYRIGCWANGIGAGDGNGFGMLDDAVAIDSDAQHHVMYRQIGRHCTAKIAGEIIGLMIGQLSLDIIQPIGADKAIQLICRLCTASRGTAGLSDVT